MENMKKVSKLFYMIYLRNYNTDFMFLVVVVCAFHIFSFPNPFKMISC